MSAGRAQSGGEREGRPSLLARARPSTLLGITLALFYLWSGRGGLQWFDSGELALVGAEAGLGHPPGQPLVTLLHALLAAAARALSLDPLSAIALLSPLSMGVAFALLYRLTLRLLADEGEAQQLRGPILLSLTPFALIYPVWDQAARVEVYALALALALAALESSARGLPRRAGLFLGACAASNVVFSLAAALASLTLFAPLLPAQARSRLRALMLTAGAGLLTLCLAYLYLLWPISADDGRMVWGAWERPGTLWPYLSGADYQIISQGIWSKVPQHAALWLRWAAGWGLLPLLIGALLALRSSLLRRRVGLPLLATLPLALFPWSYDKYWPEVPDFSAYLLLPLALLSVSLAGLFSQLAREKGARWRVTVALFSALTLLQFWNLRGSYQAASTRPASPEAVATAWLQSLPLDAILIVSSDHLLFPMSFLQQSRGLRPDLTIIGLGLSSSSWYWRQLRQRDPRLPAPPRASSRARRLRLLLDALPERPAFVESIALAATLQLPACAAPWGVELRCVTSPERDAQRAAASRAARAQLAGWSASAASADPISARVFTRLALEQAAVWWASGDRARARSWLIADRSIERAAREGEQPERGGAPVPLSLASWYSSEALIADPYHGAALLQRLSQ